MNDDRELTPMMKQYYAAKEAAKAAAEAEEQAA